MAASRARAPMTSLAHPSRSCDHSEPQEHRDARSSPSWESRIDPARFQPVRVPEASGGRVGLAAVGVDAGPLQPAAHASRAVCLGGRESRWDRAVGLWGAL